MSDTPNLSASSSTTATNKKDDASPTAGTAGLALSPDTRAENGSTTLNAKNVATPGELCGFVSPALAALCS